MEQKNILLTFDYELFLGRRSGHVSQCMIEPSDHLVEIINRSGLKAIFFVDTTCLIRLNEMNQADKCRKDLDLISEQLNRFSKQGHYIFPHIHPHWIDAKYIENEHQWDLSNTEKYRFHNTAEAQRSMLFRDSVNLLKEITENRQPVDGYRAGGWCLQPFEDFSPFFRQHGIKYEFTVLPGTYQFTDAQYFDFSDSVNEVVYKFNNDPLVPEKNGEFTQFQISTLNIPSYHNYAEKILNKVLNRISNNRTFGSGEGQPSRPISNMQPDNPGGHDLSHPGIERAAVELMSSVKLPLYRKCLDSASYMHFISHPKMITRHHLSTFNRFLEYATSKYRIESDFKSMLPS